MDISLEKHEQGCTPVEPCHTCKIVVFLQARLGDGGFAEFRRLVAEGRQKPAPQEVSTDEKRSMKLHELDLSPRVVLTLENQHNVRTVGQVLQMTEAEFLRLHGLGRKALNEVRYALQGLGLHVGMDIP